MDALRQNFRRWWQPPRNIRDREEGYRRGRIVTLISGVVMLLLGLSGLNTIPLLVVVILLLLTSVLYGVMVWIKLLGAEGIALEFE